MREKIEEKLFVSEIIVSGAIDFVRLNCLQSGQ